MFINGILNLTSPRMAKMNKIDLKIAIPPQRYTGKVQYDETSYIGEDQPTFIERQRDLARWRLTKEEEKKLAWVVSEDGSEHVVYTGGNPSLLDGDGFPWSYDSEKVRQQQEDNLVPRPNETGKEEPNCRISVAHYERPQNHEGLFSVSYSEDGQRTLIKRGSEQVWLNISKQEGEKLKVLLRQGKAKDVKHIGWKGQQEHQERRNRASEGCSWADKDKENNLVPIFKAERMKKVRMGKERYLKRIGQGPGKRERPEDDGNKEFPWDGTHTPEADFSMLGQWKKMQGIMERASKVSTPTAAPAQPSRPSKSPDTPNLPQKKDEEIDKNREETRKMKDETMVQDLIDGNTRDTSDEASGLRRSRRNTAGNKGLRKGTARFFMTSEDFPPLPSQVKKTLNPLQPAQSADTPDPPKKKGRENEKEEEETRKKKDEAMVQDLLDNHTKQTSSGEASWLRRSKRNAENKGLRKGTGRFFAAAARSGLYA